MPNCKRQHRNLTNAEMKAMEEAIAKRGGGGTPRAPSPAPKGGVCTAFAKNGFCYSAFECNYVHPGQEHMQKSHKEQKAAAAKAKAKAAAAGGEKATGTPPQPKAKGQV